MLGLFRRRKAPSPRPRTGFWCRLLTDDGTAYPEVEAAVAEFRRGEIVYDVGPWPIRTTAIVVGFELRIGDVRTRVGASAVHLSPGMNLWADGRLSMGEMHGSMTVEAGR